MFVQVIQGTVSNPTEFTERAAAWKQEHGTGAIGFMGSTAGVTDGGTAIILARFEDEQKAQANSQRPEQDAWWSQTQKLFSGEVTFRNTSDVTFMGSGGSDDAGFVQVMQGKVKNKQKYVDMMERSAPELEKMRPDVLGGLTAWFGDEYVEAIYFTSEAEAREAEARMAEGETPPEMAEFMDLTDGQIEYLDLRNPILRTG